MIIHKHWVCRVLHSASKLEIYTPPCHWYLEPGSAQYFSGYQILKDQSGCQIVGGHFSSHLIVWIKLAEVFLVNSSYQTTAEGFADSNRPSFSVGELLCVHEGLWEKLRKCWLVKTHFRLRVCIVLFSVNGTTPVESVGDKNMCGFQNKSNENVLLLWCSRCVDEDLYGVLARWSSKVDKHILNFLLSFARTLK